MHDVAVPIDLRTVIQIFIAQEIEMVIADLFRLQDDLIRL